MSLISDETKKYLLSINRDDIDFNLLVKLLSTQRKKTNNVKVPKLNPSDTFTLQANEYFNKEKILTNVGLFIYNKFIVEGKFQGVIGYINTPIDSKVLKGIEDKLSKALLEDIITTDDYVQYLNKTQWLSLKIHIIVSGSFTMSTLEPNPQIVNLRNKLIKENKEKINNKDLVTAIKIENELTKNAYKLLENDPGLNLYKSGARGSFNNNFKNISIMRGPIYNPVNDEYDIVTTNFIEGIDKKDIPAYGNTVVTGSFPRLFWGLI
jgi:hypothetical protein